MGRPRMAIEIKIVVTVVIKTTPLLSARTRELNRRTPFVRLGAMLRSGGVSSAGTYVCADLSSLPFAAGSFDLVWSNLALQWVNDVPRVLAEWRRVLKVGGLAMFATFGARVLGARETTACEK